MTQRTLAGLMAVPLLIGLWLAAVLVPLPYVTYEPGLTVDVLAETQRPGDHPGARGRRPTATTAQLRMTTVYVTQPDARVNLFELMRDWLSPDDVGLPLRRGLPPGRDHRRRTGSEGAVEMVSSQDAAVAAALERARLRREARARGARRRPGRARRRRAARCATSSSRSNGAKVTSAHAGRARPSTDAPDGQPVDLRRPPRRQARWTCPVTPAEHRRQADDRDPARDRLRRSRSTSSVNIDESIGGPSAGLMFSLGIYDTLTPGSLTGGADRRRHRHHRRRRHGRADRRHPAEDRRRPRRRRRAVPGARRTTAPTRRARRTATCAWSRPTTMHAAVAVDRDLGRGPRRDAADLRRGVVTDPDAELEPELTTRPRPRRGPRAGRGGARDRVAHRRGRLGPAGPALRAGRHRAAGRAASPRSPPRWGSTTPRRQGSLTPGRAGPARRRTGRWRRCWSRSCGRPDVTGCAAVVERLVLPPDADAQIPDDPTRRRGVRPRAPRPAGGPDRRRRHPRRVDVLCAAAARPRRRPVGGRWRRPGARSCSQLLRATLDDDGGVRR